LQVCDEPARVHRLAQGIVGPVLLWLSLGDK